jgi:hypothetical protein
MDINIRLSLDAPRGWNRRVFFYVATPLALVAAASALAYAYDTTWIKDGQPVSASALQGDLDEIQARLVTLEANHTESAVIGAGCTSISQSGPWMTLVNNGAGDCTVLFKNGTFSSAPTCVGTSYGSNGAWPRYAYVVRVNAINGVGSPDTSGGRFRHMSVDTDIAAPNGQAANEAFAIMCTGPK